MKKIYRVKVTDCIGRPNIWYADHINREFEAELRARPGTGEAVFYISMEKFIHHIDCVVVSERLEEKYSR